MMFAKVIMVLFAGQFICAISHHDEHAFLMDGQNRSEIEAYLHKAGLALATTCRQSAFYASYAAAGPDERRFAKELFGNVKHQLRPLIGFLDLTMRALNDDGLLTVGAIIETNRLMGAIDANQGLRNDLLAVANAVKGVSMDGSDRMRLEKILRKFRDEGYLVLSNPEREIYQITGKLEYLQEVIAFLSEEIGIGNDPDADQTEQDGVLL